MYSRKFFFFEEIFFGTILKKYVQQQSCGLVRMQLVHLLVGSCLKRQPQPGRLGSSRWANDSYGIAETPERRHERQERRRRHGPASCRGSIPSAAAAVGLVVAPKRHREQRRPHPRAPLVIGEQVKLHGSRRGWSRSRIRIRAVVVAGRGGGGGRRRRRAGGEA